MTKIKSSQYILDTSREYSLYVCESRSIPMATDGLKDSQRKALWLLRNRTDKTKTISVAGEMISSNLYLHGDKAAADTVSLMAAPYCNNVPFLYGIGTFGTKLVPTGIAAPRYTYVKKSKAADHIMLHDLDIVPLKDNYDGSTKEPRHFLPLIPTVLLNGISGIAVGWSTDILPRSLPDLIDSTIAALDGKPVPDIFPSYDYLNVSVHSIEPGVWGISGKVEILDTSTIRIVDIPPDMTMEKLRAKLDTMEEDGSILGYTDSSTDHIQVDVKFKRGTVKDWTEKQAIDFFKLAQRKSERLVMIDWGGDAIRQYSSVPELIHDFAKWRLGWFGTRYQKYIADTENDLTYLNGIKACFDGSLPAMLPTLKNVDELRNKISEFAPTLSIDQVTKISNLPIYSWTKDRYTKLIETISETQNRLLTYQSILSSPKKMKDIYKKELMELKKQKF